MDLLEFRKQLIQDFSNDDLELLRKMYNLPVLPISELATVIADIHSKKYPKALMSNEEMIIGQIPVLESIILNTHDLQTINSLCRQNRRIARVCEISPAIKEHKYKLYCQTDKFISHNTNQILLLIGA